jgi:glycosyltransferase involved in cell wall biosynthesis
MNLLWHMPTLRRAGCGLSMRARRLALELQEAGHAVAFLVDARNTDVDGHELDGMAIRKAFGRRERPIHWALQATARRRAAGRLAQTCDNDHDVLLSCQPEFVAARAALDRRRPIVFVCGGTTLLHRVAERAAWAQGPILNRCAFALDGRLKLRNERAAFRRADAVVFDSRTTRHLVVERYRLDPKKCRAILGGVDPDEWKPPTPAGRRDARRLLGLKPQEFVAVWTGRVAPEKNLDLLIDALARDRATADRLILVGEGPDDDRLQRRIRDARLGSVVTLAGLRDDVRPFLHAADVFVFPSRGESFGGSLIEAMACELPCVAVRPDGNGVVNASPEMIDDGVSGLIVDPAPAAMAQSLRDLRRDPSRRSRLGRAARRRVEERFTWRSGGRQLAHLLARLARLTASRDPDEPMLPAGPRPIGMSEN